MTLDDLIDAALDEDLGPGDLATEATIAPDAAGRAVIVAKQELVVAGHEVAGRVFERAAARYGGSLAYEPVLSDGESATEGQTLARISGSMRGLLVGERPARNLLMWLSGIATWTRRYVDAAAGTGLRIVDTRKTTPLWRSLEKHAVRMGGAHNHRMGLYDGCMLKDNHIAAVGSLSAAVKQARPVHSIILENGEL